MHGLVQTRGHESAREALSKILVKYLGRLVEVFGITWRYMLWSGDVAQGNTAPHFDTFSGWQLIVSFNIQGTFQLQITKGRRLVAVGPMEEAGSCQAMLMAGAHSHEISMNPLRLLHSGKPSPECRRVLVRISLKGEVDAEMLTKCNLLDLVKEIANFKELKYMHAL